MSPIVATVLLIGFTIVLFLGITTWIQKGTVGETITQSEERLAKQVKCSDVIISLESGCADNINNAGKVKINVDNNGYTGVKELFVKAIAADGTVGTAEYSAANAVEAPNRIISANTELSLKNNDGSFVSIGKIEKIEVYPKNLDGDICIDGVASITDVKQCL